LKVLSRVFRSKPKRHTRTFGVSLSLSLKMSLLKKMSSMGYPSTLLLSRMKESELLEVRMPKMHSEASRVLERIHSSLSMNGSFRAPEKSTGLGVLAQIYRVAFRSTVASETRMTIPSQTSKGTSREIIIWATSKSQAPTSPLK